MFQLSGLVGVAFYLGAYAALQFGLIRGNSHSYTLLNLAGAGFVLISLYTEFNMASALIQISWILISILGLSRLYLLSRRLRFSSEESAFLSAHLPDLPLISARALLNAGTWTDAAQGYRMLTEGEPVANLFYLAEGKVSVTSAGQVLAEVTEGFLGEINVISGAPASATAEVAQPSRLFAISRHALRRLMHTDSDLRQSLESSLNRDTGRKLLAVNKRLSSLEMS